MYLIGAPHPNKEAARLLLDRCISRGDRLVTDAEVLQEILHRYASINRPDAIQLALKTLLGIVDDVYSIEAGDVVRAGKILAEYAPWSARDALHVAIMQRYDIRRLLSFDVGFERVPGIERVAESV